MAIPLLIVALMALIAFLVLTRINQSKGKPTAPPAPAPVVPAAPAPKPVAKEAPRKSAEPAADSQEWVVKQNPTPKAEAPAEPKVAAVKIVEPTSKKVVELADEDPQMKSAIHDAREHWSEFEQFFTTRGRDNTCLAKFGFEFGEGADSGHEHMWIHVTDIKGTHVSGVLLNDPIHRKDLHKGQNLSCSLSDLSDWTYYEGASEHGGFTDPVLAKH